jgi:hypothetical protein
MSLENNNEIVFFKKKIGRRCLKIFLFSEEVGKGETDDFREGLR